MSAKKYRVKLSAEEQEELKALVSRGRAAAYKQTHARILLLSDEAQGDRSMKDEEIARSLRIGCATVERVRRRCVEEGVEAALGRKEQLKPPPEEVGRPRGSPLDCAGLRGAAGGPGRLDTEVVGGPALVECEIVDRISPETVHQTLKKPTQALAEGVCRCIPPAGSSDFVCAMEDVLEVYHRQYGDNEVLVCLDETSKQQVKETRLLRPPRPGAAGVYDYEYERNGVSNLFMLFAPLEGWRRVEVTDRRTRAIGPGWSGNWWTGTTPTKTGSCW